MKSSVKTFILAFGLQNVMEEVLIVETMKDPLIKNILELIKKDRKLYKKMVIFAYLDEKISLSKAAELLGITR